MQNDPFNLTHFCFNANSQLYPNKVCLIAIDQLGQTKQYTYEQFYTLLKSTAYHLTSFGAKKGDRLVIRSGNDLNFLLLYFAAIYIGVVPIATLTGLAGKNIEYIIENAQAKFFFQTQDQTLKITIPNDCQIIDEETLNDALEKPLQRMSHIHTFAEDPAYIIYTSGSTGTPKAVVHAQRVVLGREPIRNHMLNICPNDIVLVTGKACWTYSMGVGFIDTWAAGGTAIIVKEAFNIDRWLHIIDQNKVSLLVASPKTLKDIRNAKNHSSELTSLTRICSAGEKLAHSVHQMWQARCPVPIIEAFGMTEMSTFISYHQNLPYRHGSIGQVQPSRKIMIMDPDKPGHEVPIGEIGQLAIHRDNLGFMLGYLNNNHTSLKGDWFYSGDLLKQDQDGYIFYLGRNDDMINKAGSRVSPIEIENYVIGYDGVEDSACAMVTSPPENTPIFTLFVVIQPQFIAQEVVKGLLKFMKHGIAEHKQPQKVIIVKEIPRNSNGKIIRSKLYDL